MEQDENWRECQKSDAEAGIVAMERKKYELTDDTIECAGRTLYRIRALIDIPSLGVEIGDWGGFIEAEKNLSHDSNAWVGGNARVYGVACVYDSAEVYGHAKVHSFVRVHSCSKVHGYGDVAGGEFG